MKKEKKLVSKLKKLFGKKKNNDNSSKDRPANLEQEEVKKRLKSLGYFDE